MSRIRGITCKEDRHKSTCRICGIRFPGRCKYCLDCEKIGIEREQVEKGKIREEKKIKKRERNLKASLKRKEKRKEKTKRYRIKNTPIKICPACRKEFKTWKKTAKYCSNHCKGSNKPTETAKMNASISSLAYYNTPQGQAHKAKRSRQITKYNAGKDTTEVNREDFAVVPPDVYFEEDFEDLFPNYEKGDVW